MQVLGEVHIRHRSAQIIGKGPFHSQEGDPKPTSDINKPWPNVPTNICIYIDIYHVAG